MNLQRPMAVDPKATQRYTNRELSWLGFNKRVLALAERTDVPLLERVKFLAITAGNLNEFFMVRVGGLERHRRRPDHTYERGPDGLSLEEVLERVWSEGSALTRTMAEVLYEQLLPALTEADVHLQAPATLTPELRDRVHDYYRAEVHPCLTPIAVDHSHPFPSLRSGTINLAVRVEATSDRGGPFELPPGPLLAVVQLPSLLPRFVHLGTDLKPNQFMALEDVISLFVGEVFAGFRILETTPFRVTRASDLDFDEDIAENLLTTIQDELRRRDRGEPVRLEVDEDASDLVKERLRTSLDVEPWQVQTVKGLIDPSALFSILSRIKLPEHRDEPFAPVQHQRLNYGPTLFQSIRERDFLLHHPYESFRHVVDFLEQAAADEDVVAIKITLYRTSGDSPIVRALQRAAEAGKEVTALVELKARFDEANNIVWAQQLEESGAHVVYGLIGLKTHSKMLLVTRREGDRLQRYAHLATGNYNPKTANLYTDLGLLTADEDMTHDVMMLFNVLTGYAELPPMRRLVVAPFTMRSFMLDRIEREIAHAKADRPSGIRAKMNSLVDGEMIDALYRASQAGVRIDLVVRGICCLRPQIPGVSENIRVRSILDRFLEHARVYCWTNGGEDEVMLASADWMPRNLNRRIEVGFPILHPKLKKRITDELFPLEWADNCFSWELKPDGSYQRREPNGAEPVRAQTSFMALSKAHHEAPRMSPRPDVPPPQRISPVVRAARAQLRRLDSGVKRHH